jgi:hypothetical protein
MAAHKSSAVLLPSLLHILQTSEQHGSQRAPQHANQPKEHPIRRPEAATNRQRQVPLRSAGYRSHNHYARYPPLGRPEEEC